MSYLILVDEHEQDELVPLLKQWSDANVIQTGLNTAGLADIVWHDKDSKMEQIERKKWNQLVSDGIEKCEYQLNKHLATGAKTIFVVEGLAIPYAKGILIYEERNSKAGNHVWTISGSHQTNYQMFENWFVSLERQGVLVWKTPNVDVTVAAIVELVKTANKQSLNTLNRHLKLKSPFKANPYVMTLTGIDKGGIGVTLAEALINHYKNPWAVFNASPQDIANNIPGMGVVKARQLLQALGRNI